MDKSCNGAYRFCTMNCICKKCKNNNSDLKHRGNCYPCRDCYENSITKQCQYYENIKNNQRSKK